MGQPLESIAELSTTMSMKGSVNQLLTNESCTLFYLSWAYCALSMSQTDPQSLTPPVAESSNLEEIIVPNAIAHTIAAQQQLNVPNIKFLRTARVPLLPICL